MLEMFANHLALAQEAFGVGAPVCGGALEPTKLAEMLVFSFVEDIWFALISSEYTYPPIELHSVGTLKRVEGGAVVFSPDVLLFHEIDTKQQLLDGAFWKIMCRVDAKEEIFYAPSRLSDRRIHSTARLLEVAECILMVSQRHNPFFCDVLLETLWRGLCLAIHDAICGSAGFYLERIGTFFHGGHFEPDHLLLTKIRAGNNIPDKDQYSIGFPETRRKAKNLAWYWE